MGLGTPHQITPLDGLGDPPCKTPRMGCGTPPKNSQFSRKFRKNIVKTKVQECPQCTKLNQNDPQDQGINLGGPLVAQDPLKYEFWELIFCTFWGHMPPKIGGYPPTISRRPDKKSNMTCPPRRPRRRNLNQTYPFLKLRFPQEASEPENSRVMRVMEARVSKFKGLRRCRRPSGGASASWGWI